MSLVIRPITEGDAAKIETLAKEFTASQGAFEGSAGHSLQAVAYVRDGFGSDPAFSGLIADYDGESVGYLLYHHAYDTARGIRMFFVTDLYVRSEHQRRGIGKALMEEVTEKCRQAGGRRLIWLNDVRNESAWAFYLSLEAGYLPKTLVMLLDV